MKSFVTISLAASVQATKHVLYASTYINSNIFALEFDTESLSLTLKENITTVGPHTIISFNHNKTTLYGVEQGTTDTVPGYYDSYAITSEQSLVHTSRLVMSANCSYWTYPFILASPVEPYNVYGAPYGDCGHVMSTTDDGTLEEITSTWTYEEDVTRIHGLELSPDSSVLYSADLAGNQVWSHDIDATTGAVTAVTNQIEASVVDGNPRSVKAHPGGEYMYTLLEEGHVVSSYAVGADGALTLDREFELEPEIANITGWKGNNIELSPSGNYLWAANRGLASSTNVGYLHGFSLNANGSMAEHVVTVPMATGGGPALSVTPAFFDDQWLAVADERDQTVTIFNFNAENKTLEIAAVWYSTTECCSMALWYS